jgi:hypothetical protein
VRKDLGIAENAKVVIFNFGGQVGLRDIFLYFLQYRGTQTLDFRSTHGNKKIS